MSDEEIKNELDEEQQEPQNQQQEIESAEDIESTSVDDIEEEFQDKIDEIEDDNAGTEIEDMNLGEEDFGDDDKAIDDYVEDGVVDIDKVQLDSLLPDDNGDKGKLKMDLLMNLSLTVSIELGRTQMLIKDILNLGVGSIIELNKLAGEPVDLLVNNKKFAEGEVVVIDENFGIRITNLVKSPHEMDRINEAITSKL